MNLKTIPYQKVTIPAGGVAYIPSGATIIGKSSTGDTVASSDCVDLDSAETMLCYEVGFISSADANNNMPLTHDTATLVNLTIDSDVYTINILFKQLNANSFATLPTDLITITQVVIDPDSGGTDKKDGAYLRFQTIPTIANKMVFMATGEGYPNGIYMKPYTITCSEI